MYASERDGDYYECLCGDTEYHSYLTSERDNTRLMDCCKKKGYEYFTIGTVQHLKRPNETYKQVVRKYKNES